MKYVTAGVLFLFSITLCAQEGDFYMDHYSPQELSANYRIYDVETDKNGLLWLATNYGLIRYDGISWDFFETPSAALSLLINDSNEVYAGCVGEVGKMVYQKSKFSYKSLTTSDSLSDIYQKAEILNNVLYFQGNSSLIYIKGDSIESINDEFINLYRSDSVLIAVSESFRYEFTEYEKYEKAPLEENAVLFTIKHNDKEISYKSDGKLYEGGYSLAVSFILEEYGIIPTEGALLNDSSLVLSTLDLGVVFLNLNDTSYFRTADYHSGLPDNEIFALHIDQENGVWVAHEYGLTRILPLFPTRIFSSISGLKGNMSSAIWNDNTLWLTTSLGVFYLEKDTTFRQKVYYDVIPIRTSTPQPKKQNKQEKEKDDKKGFLGGLFGKNDKQKNEEKKPGLFQKIGKKLEDVFYHENLTDRIQGKKEKNVRYVRREENIPVNVSIAYEQVPGTDGKFEQFIVLNGNLLASGTSGIFEIEKDESFLVIDEPFKQVLTTSSNQLLGYTYSNDLVLFEKDEDVWIELWKIPINDEILSLYEDQNRSIWLAGPKSLYKTNISDTSMILDYKIDIDNQFFDKIDIIEMEGKMGFLSTLGFFDLDEDRRKVTLNKKITDEIGNPEKHLKDNLGNIWSYNGKKWFRISTKGEVQSFEYLSLFPQIESLYLDERSEDYWLITKDNQLLTYNLSEEINLGDQYNLIVKRINSQSKIFRSDQDFILDFEDNSLVVELSKPDYTGLLNTQYQYKLEGLNNEWSEWTSSTVIDFSYLPPGKYALKVRSKDSFERVNEAELLSFQVQEPYWQTPWFYSLQVIIFFSLVIVSSRLNQSLSANRFLSGALTIFTIVLLIEFLQSVIGSYFSFKSGPVIEFLIDAVIAVCIFPLESFLRNIITRGIPDRTLQRLSRTIIFGVQKVMFGFSKKK